jgi:hypothetical protein
MDAKEMVTISVTERQVKEGFWNGDETAEYAIKMDNGSWYRSHDWATFGRMYGWENVARIVKEIVGMPYYTFLEFEDGTSRVDYWQTATGAARAYDAATNNANNARFNRNNRVMSVSWGHGPDKQVCELWLRPAD